MSRRKGKEVELDAEDMREKDNAEEDLLDIDPFRDQNLNFNQYFGLRCWLNLEWGYFADLTRKLWRNLIQAPSYVHPKNISRRAVRFCVAAQSQNIRSWNFQQVLMLLGS